MFNAILQVSKARGLRSFGIRLFAFTLALIVFSSSFFISTFQAAAQATDETTASILVCRDLVRGSYDVLTSIDSGNDSLFAGQTLTAQLTVAHSYQHVVGGIAAYAFLFPTTEDNQRVLSYPVAHAVTESVGSLAPDTEKQVAFEMPIAPGTSAGRYVVKTIVGQMDFETALLHAINDQQIASEETVQIAESTIRGVVVADDAILVNEQAVLQNAIHTIPQSDDPATAELTITNTQTAQPTEVTVTSRVYEGVLPTADALISEEERELFLLSTLSDTRTIEVADEPGVYLLWMQIVSGDYVEHVFVPVVSEFYDQNVGGFASIDHLAMVEGSLVGCASYSPARIDTSAMPSPETTTLSYEFTNTVNGAEVTTVSGQTAPLTFQQNNFAVSGQSTAGAEYTLSGTLRTNEAVLDSVSFTVSCADTDTCQTSASPSTTTAVSPLKTTLGVAILLIIAFLPIMAAIRLLKKRKSSTDTPDKKSRKKSATDTSTQFDSADDEFEDRYQTNSDEPKQ